MDKRKTTNLDHLRFKPFDKYGEPIKVSSWYKFIFTKKTYFVTFIFKLNPVTETLKHKKRLFNFNFHESTLVLKKKKVSKL